MEKKKLELLFEGLEGTSKNAEEGREVVSWRQASGEDWIVSTLYLVQISLNMEWKSQVLVSG